MSQSRKIRNVLMSLGAIGALALGGSALADAASTTVAPSTTATSTSTPAPAMNGSAPSRPDPMTPGGHVGADGQREAALSTEVAAKVKAAALAKVSGATLERVETDVDHGSPYEAHLRKADGTELDVLVDRDFKVTAVGTMGHP